MRDVAKDFPVLAPQIQGVVEEIPGTSATSLSVCRQETSMQ